MKFLEHLALISDALRTQGLWNEEDGFFYDRLVSPDGSMQNVEVRSIVGILPLLAVAVIDERVMEQAQTVNKRSAGLLSRRQEEVARLVDEGVLPPGVGKDRLLLGVVGVERLLRLFKNLFDESSFLSPYGLRAVSRYHLDHPFEIELDGQRSTIDYEPAESTTGMFGGNSNWRGPIWFPINYLVVSALQRYARFFGDAFTVEYPTGSGTQLPLGEVADDLRDRLISLFLVGRGRAAPVLRLGRAAPGRPGLEGQHPLQRVLPRRQRRRARRLAPDRLDGDRRRPDRPRPRPRLPDARRAARDGAPRPRSHDDPVRPADLRHARRGGGARVARLRRRRRLRDGHGRRAANAALPRAARPGDRRAVCADARARRARAGARRRRRALRARDRRMGRRATISPRGQRAARHVRPRGRRAALALAGRRHRARARGRDRPRPVRGRRSSTGSSAPTGRSGSS